MILKTLVDTKERKWWFVDNIIRLSHKKIEPSDKSEDIHYSTTMRTLDISKPHKGYLLVCFLQSNGDEQLYALNDITYLLNDEGKTIERIW